MNNKKILFLSFTPIFSRGGHSKNFQNLLKHIEPELKKNNYTANIISYNNSSLEKDNDIVKIPNVSFLNFYKIKIRKRVFPSGNRIFQILEYIFNFFKNLLFIIIERPDFIYSYSDKPLYLTFPLKKLFKFKLIYDIRGDILDEHRARGGSKRYLSILSKVHSKALNSVDLAFTVSDSYNTNSKVRFIPKYNYYDGEIFRYDEAQMLEKKKELKLDDMFVFVYNGNTHYYQYLDGTVKFFSQFLEKRNDSFFIIITEHDSSKFIELLNKYNIPETSYLIKSLPQSEICELQQVADMGFLLRENLPLNHHSFPTKFAEYLASGVPVLMTPYIYSIVPMVTEYNLGEVIDIKNDYSAEIDKIYPKYKSNLSVKNRCSQFAQTELMWQKKAKSIFMKIEQL